MVSFAGDVFKGNCAMHVDPKVWVVLNTLWILTHGELPVEEHRAPRKPKAQTVFFHDVFFS